MNHQGNSGISQHETVQMENYVILVTGYINLYSVSGVQNGVGAARSRGKEREVGDGVHQTISPPTPERLV